MEPFISIRLFSRYHEDQDLTDSLIHVMDKYPGCADDVWLTTRMGFPKLEEHKKSAKLMKISADKLREHGYKITLQLANTIGHGDLGTEYSFDMFSKHMQNIDGNALKYHACPNDEAFLKYVHDFTFEYANEIKPEFLFVDDDLRLIAGEAMTGCFCDECIERFNKLNNFSYSRKSLKTEMFEKDNTALTVKWREFCDLSLSRVMEAVISGAMEGASDITIGMQLGNHVNYELYHKVAQKVIDMTGKKPLLRAGGGSYSDIRPFDLLLKAYDIQYQCEFLSDYIDNFRPELEGYPHTIFNKSPRGFNTEASIALATGCNSVSYAAIVVDNEPLEYFEPLFKSISEYRTYFTTLAKISECTVSGGLRNPIYLQRMTEKTGYIGNPLEMAMLLKAGIPMAYSYKCNSDTVYINSLTADVISEEELKALLSKNVIIESEALEVFKERKMLDLIGVEYRMLTLKEFLPENEVLTDDVINKGIAGNNWSSPLWLNPNSKPEFTNAKNMRVLSKFRQTQTAASVIFDSKFGGKIACLGSTGTDMAPLNSSKSLMIKRLISEFTNEGFAYAEKASQLTCMIRLTENKKLKAVTLFNYGMDYIKDTKLFVKNTVGDGIILHQPLTESVKTDSLTISEIAPGGVVTLEFVND